MYDVIIIGAGVSGSAIARECSRFPLKLRFLKSAKTFAAELPRQTVRSFMPAMMPKKVR